MDADRLPCTRTDDHDSHDWITMDDGLKLHRCPGSYAAVDLPELPPLAPTWSDPLTGPERAEIGRRMDLADEVLTSLPTASEVPEPLAVAPAIVPELVEGPAPAAGGVVEPLAEGGCSLFVPLKGISTERVRALGLGSLAFKRKGFLGAYDSWMCEPCGSRAFEPRECCGSPMRPVRVEIHAREVP